MDLNDYSFPKNELIYREERTSLTMATHHQQPQEGTSTSNNNSAPRSSPSAPNNNDGNVVFANQNAGTNNAKEQQGADEAASSSASTTAAAIYRHRCTQCAIAFRSEARLRQHQLAHTHSFRLAQKCPFYRRQDSAPVPSITVDESWSSGDTFRCRGKLNSAVGIKKALCIKMPSFSMHRPLREIK